MCQRSFLSLSIAAACLAAVPCVARTQERKEPTWLCGFDFKVHSSKEATFEVHTFGVEAYKDKHAGRGLYISQTGSLAASAFDGLDAELRRPESPLFVTGLDLRVRKTGVTEWESAKTWALEVFFDSNIGNWMYVTESGMIAAVAGPKPAKEKILPPDWLYSFDLRCRKAGAFEEESRFGIEVYRDANTNHLIYICETGHLAVIPEGARLKPPVKATVQWTYALDLRCRRHDQEEFNADSPKRGIEVFRDDVTGNLLYLCESGALSVVRPGKGLNIPLPKAKDAVWRHGFKLRARKPGEMTFTKKTRAFGVECFDDLNAGMLLYIAETGALTVIPAMPPK